MSTLAVSLLTLERLQQQVDGGSYSVAAACSRIEDIIRNMCKDEMTRPLIGALPRLLSILLGDGAIGAVGWIERVSDEASAHGLWKLLQPTGAVFTAALSYSNGEGPPPFEISTGDLPMPLVKQLARTGPRSAPLPLDACLVNVAKEGSPSYALRLDVGEFFILQLLKLLPTFHRHAMASSASASSPGLGRRQAGFAFSRSISFESVAIRHGTEKAFRFDHEHSARLYYKLIEAYLQFFLPTEPATAPSARKDGEGTAFSIRSLRTSTGAWTGWRLSSFFFTILAELWLHRHDYFLGASDRADGGDGGKVTSEPPFVLPSVDHFEVLRQVTRHLVRAVVCPIPNHIPLQLARFYEQLADFAFVPFRFHLYRFLRLCLANCPSDHMIVPLGSLWLEFVAPWRYIDLDSSESINEQWSAYVGGNYFFYHTLVSSLLNQVEGITESFGMAVGRELGPPSNTAAVSAVSLPLETAQNVLLPLLIVFGKVLAAVGPFAGFLREVEASELDPGGRRGGDSASIVGSAYQMGVRSPPQGPMQFRVKEQMSALEAESFRIELLFGAESTRLALRILYWLEAIYAAIPGALDEAKGRAASGGFRHDGERSSDYDIHAVIMQCEEELCEIFSIGEQDFLLFSSRFDATATSSRHQASAGGASWTRRRKVIGPAMDPDAKIQQKMQITNGDERVIKSYEISLLVNLTGALSDMANKQWTRVMQLEELDRLPGSIRNVRFNFRFLAAYPNLLFIFGIMMVIRVALWLLRVVLF